MQENTQNDIAISFSNVTKTYTLYKNDKQRLLGQFFKKRIKGKQFKAIDNISLEIKKGESVGIVGKNGAGKSTLLKIITGVTFPESGSAVINGQVAALLELAAGFDNEMTGRENIYLKGYILGLTEDKIKLIEKDVIDFAELGDFIDQPVRTFSSGMKSRLGFAVNANVSPDILVIDEALSVGDAEFGEKCRKKVAQLMDSGVTILFVSHQAERIKEFCNRAIYLEKGKVKMDGDVEQVLEIYKTNQMKDKIEKEKNKPKTYSILPDKK